MEDDARVVTHAVGMRYLGHGFDHLHLDASVLLRPNTFALGSMGSYEMLPTSLNSKPSPQLSSMTCLTMSPTALSPSAYRSWSMQGWLSLGEKIE